MGLRGVGSALGQEPGSPLFRHRPNGLPLNMKYGRTTGRMRTHTELPFSFFKVEKKDAAKEKSGRFMVGAVPPPKTQWLTQQWSEYSSVYPVCPHVNCMCVGI